MLVAIAHNAVSADAREDERDVLVQAEAVAGAVRESGHSCELVPMTLDLDELLDRLRRLQPAVVFNLMECLGGSDRLAALAAAAVESAGLPLTGSSAETLWLSNHKTLAKRYLLLADLPTPPWLEPAGNGTSREGWKESLLLGLESATAGQEVPSGMRFIIKPLFEHASLGMDAAAVVTPQNRADLAELVRERARQLGRPCFAEQFIEGREFNVSLLAAESGCEVLPLAEIDFSAFPAGQPRIVDYRAKWDPASFEFHHTPRRFLPRDEEPALHEELSRLARKCWDTFQLRGHVRVDFRVDHQGRPWILEVNTNPCLSPDAGFQAALKQAGISFSRAVERILEEVLRGAGSAGQAAGRPASSAVGGGTGSPADLPARPPASVATRPDAAIQWRSSVRPDDPARVRGVVAATGYFYPDEVAVAEELVSERLAKGESSGYFFVFAEQDGDLVGYACFGPIACTRHSHDLYWIAVHPRYQGSGMGKLILRQAEEQIHQMGGQRVYIETSNRAQYAPTRAFYDRCGYLLDATLAEFYGPGDDKVIYVKVLS